MTVKDQYGKEMPDAAVIGYKVTLTKESGADTLFSAPTAGDLTLDNVIGNDITITAGNTSGTETFTYSLVKTSDNSTLSSVTATVKVVDATTGIASYGVDTVKTLFAPKSDELAIFKDAHAAAKYDVTPVVYGKDSNGNKIALSNAEKGNFVYVSNNPAVAQMIGGKLRGIAKGSTTVDVYKDNKLDTKIATISVTVDDARPAIASIADPKDADITIANGGAGTVYTVSDASIVDQYGIEWIDNVITGAAGHKMADAGLVVVSSDTGKITNANVEVATTGSLKVTATDAVGTSTATPVIITIAGNGIVQQFKITVTDNNN